MKLYIEHAKEVAVRNIDGKALLHRHKYFVYRKVFGFIRRYIDLSSQWESSFLGGYDATIKWTGFMDAYDFGSREVAEEFIKRVGQHPDKFITYH